MSKPFEWYVEQYNMVRNSRSRAAFRFSKGGWEALMKYRQWEIEDAVKNAVKKPELQQLKELRFRPLLCDDCNTRGIFGGAAMTTWICPNCKRSQLSGSTATGVLCHYCAFGKFCCTNCGESLDKDL